MKLSIISFTNNGLELSKRVSESLTENTGITTAVYTKCSLVKTHDTKIKAVHVEKSIADWTKEQMQEKNAILFIGACGIAVRAIAPNLTDKLHDSPVLVLDEQGQYVIPLLAGHYGGANELAVQIAEKINAIPVITTATDLQNKFAVDLFAKRNGLRIINKDGIAKISAKVLAGNTSDFLPVNGCAISRFRTTNRRHCDCGKSKTGASDKHRRIAPITAQRVCRRNGM